MFCRVFLILFLSIRLTFVSNAQISFTYDTTFFANEYVSKVSVGLDGNVWAIKDTSLRQIGRVSTSFVASDISSSVQTFVSSKFNDLQGMDSNTVLIGTEGDYLVRLKNNNPSKIGLSEGVLNKNINSIMYIRNTNSLFLPQNYQTPVSGLSIGSDSGLYTSMTQGKTFTKFNMVTSFNTRCVIHYYDDYTVMFDSEIHYYPCSNSNVKAQSNNFYGTGDYYDFYPTSSDTLLPGKINSAVTILPYYYAVDIIFSNVYYGTSNGVSKKKWNTYCPTTWDHFLVNRTVNKLYEFKIYPYSVFHDTNLQERFLLAGSDSGLYYSNLKNAYPKDTFLLVPNTAQYKIYDIDADSCSNAIWLATDKGLVRFLVNSLSKTIPSINASIYPNINRALCSGGSTILTANSNLYAGLAYQWLKNNVPIAGANSQNYQTNIPGNYSVRISSCFGTDTSGTDSVYLDSSVVSTFNYTDTINICQGSSYLLQTSKDNSYQYSWFKNGMNTGNTSNSFTTTDSGNYKIIISNCNGYNKVDSVYIKVNVVPLPIISYSAVTLCEGDSLPLSSSPAYSTILWYKNGSLMPQGNNNTFITAKSSGNYSVEYLFDASCKKTSSPITLNFNSFPTLQIKSSKNPGCEGDTIKLSLLSNANSFLWSDNSTSPELDVTVAGIYSVIANKAGCKKKDSILIDFNPLPLFNLGSDITFCEGDLQPVTLKIKPGYSYYSWNGIMGDSIYKVYKAGIYFAQVSNTYGCNYSDTIVILDNCDPIFIPNLITPDKDGKNDSFIIKGLITNSRMSIYNQWGSQVYYSENYNNDWVAPVEDGIYYYFLRNEYYNKDWKGWIEVMR